MHTPHPEIAIIDGNTLACIGLQSILERIIPAAIVRTFNTFAQLTADTPDAYFHYFVSTQLAVEHNTFFVERVHKTILLSTHTATASPLLGHFRTLNINLPEEQLVKELLKMHQSGHAPHHPHQPVANEQMVTNNLTPREIDVLRLVVSGFINKEIADKLYISLPTVITHRKNIVEKLGIRSVSGLTIYAVMHGYVEADAL